MRRTGPEQIGAFYPHIVYYLHQWVKGLLILRLVDLSDGLAQGAGKCSFVRHDCNLSNNYVLVCESIFVGGELLTV